mmetsp:Transcript_5369/g.16023  ORF Transcript_5369/g.16023 Transcript_5369/m.16023 type:complete len:102 (+) Transcript_5369:73-378(+)
MVVMTQAPSVVNLDVLKLQWPAIQKEGQGKMEEHAPVFTMRLRRIEAKLASACLNMHQRTGLEDSKRRLLAVMRRRTMLLSIRHMMAKTFSDEVAQTACVS